MKNIVEGKKGTSGRVECLSYVDSVHRVTDVVAETFEGGLMEGVIAMSLASGLLRMIFST